MARGAPRLRTADGRVNDIAERVRARRLELRLTQDGLCGRLAHVTAGAWNADRMEVYRIETGTRIVSDLELRALASALDCDPSWLLLGEPSTRRSTASTSGTG